jgi:predicted transcriptional regulator
MNVKEQLMKVAAELPENAGIDDAIERLLFLEKLERGLKQADEGKKLSHDAVKEKMRLWLK